jgi:hypothetical protein
MPDSDAQRQAPARRMLPSRPRQRHTSKMPDTPNVKHSPAHAAEPPASAAARQHALGLVLWLGVFSLVEGLSH